MSPETPTPTVEGMTAEITAQHDEDRPDDEEVTNKVAEKHERALAIVRNLLHKRGVRTTPPIHRISLKLTGNGPYPRGDWTRYAPHLIAYSGAGWVAATLTIGTRSRMYLVSLPQAGVTCQMVNGDQPQAVVDLILAALPKTDLLELEAR